MFDDEFEFVPQPTDCRPGDPVPTSRVYLRRSIANPGPRIICHRSRDGPERLEKLYSGVEARVRVSGTEHRHLLGICAGSIEIAAESRLCALDWAAYQMFSCAPLDPPCDDGMAPTRYITRVPREACTRRIGRRAVCIPSFSQALNPSLCPLIHFPLLSTARTSSLAPLPPSHPPPSAACSASTASTRPAGACSSDRMASPWQPSAFPSYSPHQVHPPVVKRVKPARSPASPRPLCTCSP